MSAEKPTTSNGDVPADSVTDFWDGVEGQTRGEPEAGGEPTTPQAKPEGEKGWRKRVLSRPARVAAGAALFVLAVALAWVVVPTLMREGSAPRPRPATGALPAKARKADKRGSGRTRWVREPDASPRPRQTHEPETPRSQRRTRLRHEPSRPAPPPPESASQPPASGAAPPPPVPTPGPSSPAPTSTEPKEEPGIRDGATESDEFGL